MTLAIILFFLILFSIASYSSDLRYQYSPPKPYEGYEYWLQWTTITIMVFVLFLADLMFLSDHEFVFDPNWRSWEASQNAGNPYS